MLLVLAVKVMRPNSGPRQRNISVYFFVAHFTGGIELELLKCKYTDSSYSATGSSADSFSRADYFPGILSPASTRKLQCYESPGCTFVRVRWGEHHGYVPAHGENVTTPLLLAVIDELKSYGVTQFVAAGYCIGGLYVTRLVQNNTITVGTMSHPSFLDVPADFELMKAQSHVPIEINNAEFDTLFTTELAAETDEVMLGQYPPGYKRLQYNGVGHGFTVRANASDPVQVAAKEGAFHASLSWIKDHLVY
ncbi:hypothetical protein BDZ89DRAFT_1166036 [Hymenopellis radicata]|nr:hypothetical protein BDZ89DRAFT_1166036 [Hymenopellis radicata]